MISGTVVGHLGADPELKYLANGTPVLELRIASNDGKDEEPTWVRASWFGSLAEKAAQWFAKGERVCFRGTFKERGYTTKDGVQRVSLEMRVEGFEFVGDKKPAERQERPAPQAQRPAAGRPAPRTLTRPARPAAPSPDEGGYGGGEDIPF